MIINEATIGLLRGKTIKKPERFEWKLEEVVSSYDLKVSVKSKWVFTEEDAGETLKYVINIKSYEEWGKNRTTTYVHLENQSTHEDKDEMLIRKEDLDYILYKSELIYWDEYEKVKYKDKENNNGNNQN